VCTRGHTYRFFVCVQGRSLGRCKGVCLLAKLITYCSKVGISAINTYRDAPNQTPLPCQSQEVAMVVIVIPSDNTAHRIEFGVVNGACSPRDSERYFDNGDSYV